MNNKRLKKKLDKRGIEHVPFEGGFAIDADNLSEENRKWLIGYHGNKITSKIKKLIKKILR